ncbi:MAG TPA: metal ABC transporter substrate-binding protein [Candidatus Cloacimonadota bacterium]|nr:metal ABC transporter substrate-binding protein [Candidatus Cloacimonadota bacterium]HQB40826.1 metal ABC transporter substrate-binding protein [Candidatus Cloacimonadota bacterium]
MIKHFKIASIILLIISVFACQKQIPKSKPTIVTTIYPYELMIRQIVQDKVDVYCLIPPNSSPHTYSPLPEDIVIINSADLIFANGLGAEPQFEKVFKPLGDKVVEASSFIPKAILEYELRTNQKFSFNIKDENAHELNPHIWLHPENLIDIARGITSRISTIMPEHRKFFEHNLEELISDVTKADRNIIKEREKLDSIKIISFHDAFYYFDLRYYIQSFGLIQKSPGQEPTAQDLEKIAQTIISDHIELMVTEPQLNPKAVQVLANNFNLPIISLDPIGQSINAHKVSDLLTLNWDIIYNGLK